MSSPTFPPALIIGASRGLGLALVKHLASSRTVYATVRSSPKPGQFPDGVRVIEGVDVSKEDAGKTIVDGLKGDKVGLVAYVSGVLKPEEPLAPKWQEQIDMYTISSIAPVFIMTALQSSLASSSKFLFLTSEGGSIALRTEKEGGGMYGHHGSKAASNMIGKLLAYDLKDKGVAVAMIHPGFLKTEMTKGAGMEDAYEEGGAITPEEACPGIVDFIDQLDIKDTGKFWAPNGAKGIGGAEEVMGKEVLEKKGPVLLPW